jgi:tripartite ATP-independent transporter DctP family solute receptor
MKLRILLATAVLVIFGASLAQAKPVEVRYGLWAKQGEAQYLGAVKFKEILEKESNGRYHVTVFPGDQLGTPREMLAQLALGTTQICASGDPGLPVIEVMAVPYLMKSIKNYEAVMKSDIGKEWNDQLVSKRRIRLLGFMPRSPRQISANVVINSLDDLKGIKLRAPERDYYMESLAGLGAKPTPMAFKEVYTALQTGVVDGQENPIETIYAMKFYEVQKCVAMVDYINKPAYVMICNSFWKRLSDEDKALFQKAQAASRQEISSILPKQQTEYIDKMKQKGLTITFPDKAPFIEATQKVRDNLGKKYWGEETYQKIKAIGAQDL